MEFPQFSYASGSESDVVLESTESQAGRSYSSETRVVLRKLVSIDSKQAHDSPNVVQRKKFLPRTATRCSELLSKSVSFIVSRNTIS